jgi:Fur family transcriptional regulator, ferric uptake regulator
VSIPSARETFRKFLAQKGLRVTSQRLAIFDAAFARKEHFTAEQLLDYARSIDDSVSRATVYRTLPIMIRSALLREIDIGSGEKFYMPNLEQNTQIAQVFAEATGERPMQHVARHRVMPPPVLRRSGLIHG